MRRLLALVGVAITLSACGGGTTTTFVPLPTPTPIVYHSIQYVVTGRDGASLVDLTIQNSDGGTSQYGAAPMPWSYGPFQAAEGSFIYVSGQNDSDHGCVRTQILRDKILFKDSESCGAFVIATASGEA